MQLSIRRRSGRTEPKSDGEIQKLSDKELLNELKKLGESPGPINASTRVVYERKLLRMRTESSSSSVVKDRSPTRTRRQQQQRQPTPVIEDSYVAEWTDESDVEDSGNVEVCIVI